MICSTAINTACNVTKYLAGGALSVFYVLVGTGVCLSNFALQQLSSFEYPLLEKWRQFITIFLRMMFCGRSYSRVCNDEDAVKRGNEYIDKLLGDMFQDRVEEYDPYVLEDSVVGFNKKVMFVNVSGEAKLHNGYIKGLSTLHRSSHCSLHDDGDRLQVKADLGAGVLDFHYSGSVKFMNFGPTITVHGHLSYIEVHMEFTVDSKTGKEGKLTQFVIDDMRGMKVWVTGLGPLNWAVNPIIKGVTKIFKRFVRNFMENKVEKHISQRIPNFQFPVEGSDNTETPVTVPTEEPEETTQPETIAPETESPEETSQTESETVPTETPDSTTEPKTLPPETEAPEETAEPETEAPEETAEPETNPPETEAPEETAEPETNPQETEAPEETAEPETNPPETESPEETAEPETNPPETESPEETAEPEEIPPETEAPEEIAKPETLPPETEVPEEAVEPETVPREEELVENSSQSEVILPETDSSEEKRNIPKIVVSLESEESYSDERV